MSALNVIRQRSVVHMLSDAAGYDGDGVVQKFVLKQLPLPHLNCVIGSRGSIQASYVIAAALGMAFASFDAMLDGVEDVMRDVIENHLPPTELSPRIDLTIAGWSQRRGRAESYFLQTDNNDWQPDDNLPPGDVINPEPFTTMELAELSLVPAFPAAALKAAVTGRGRSVAGVEDLDPVIDGLRVLEVQRQQRFARIAGGVERHWVGGFAVMASVTKDAITQRIIHRWPDKLGDHIQPAPIDWREWNAQHRLVDAPQPISRLKADMMRRKAAKASSGL